MTDTAPVKQALEAGDADALRALVAADPALRDADVRFGPDDRHAVPPLHYACDLVFREVVSQEQGLALAEVLLAAGVDADRVYAKSGDTFLIAAASLGAEGIGLRLLEHGVDIHGRGLFGATALHWAAFMGADRLAGALAAAGGELELRDVQHECTPLEWALHAWTDGTNGSREGVPRAARALVARGARVPADAAAQLAGEDDGPMREALGLPG